MSKKIIVVFGATGAQGGGLAHAILKDTNSEFAVRAVTRDVSSDKARDLAKLGAEVVAGDVDDPASVRRTLEGGYGAYFVTFFCAQVIIGTILYSSVPTRKKERTGNYTLLFQSVILQWLVLRQKILASVHMEFLRGDRT